MNVDIMRGCIYMRTYNYGRKIQLISVGQYCFASIRTQWPVGWSTQNIENLADLIKAREKLYLLPKR